MSNCPEEKGTQLFPVEAKKGFQRHDGGETAEAGRSMTGLNDQLDIGGKDEIGI